MRGQLRAEFRATDGTREQPEREPYLIRTRNNPRELVGLLLLALDHGLQDGGVVGA